MVRVAEQQTVVVGRCYRLIWELLKPAKLVNMTYFQR